MPSAGTSLLIGKPKVGKSTLARTIALKVARGEPVLGRATLQTPVLYLVMEEKRSEIAEWFRTAEATTEPLWLYVGQKVEEPCAFVAGHAAQRDVRLVIVDPLHALLGASDINDYFRVNRAITPLIELARGEGIHLMLLHHQGKGDRGGGDRVLGSTALFGAVDALITMTRTDDAFLVDSIQRYGTDLEPTQLARDEATGILGVAGTVTRMRDRAVEDLILERLGDGSMTESELRESIQKNTVVVHRVLRQMLESEDAACSLVRTGSGRRANPYRYSRRVTSPPQAEDGSEAT